MFNKTVRIDLMFINGEPVLHAVDAGTTFSSARFLSAENTETIWNTFLYAWVTMYVGIPEDMLADHGSAFTAKNWEDYCKAAGVNLRFTGTESHNSMGQGETYHSMLRRIYNKVSMTYPRLPKELRLAYSVKAMNDTAGPNGLVPSPLLFGVHPRMPDTSMTLPTQQKRFEAMELARKEY